MLGALLKRKNGWRTIAGSPRPRFFYKKNLTTGTLALGLKWQQVYIIIPTASPKNQTPTTESTFLHHALICKRIIKVSGNNNVIMHSNI
jgi:hypothetical protein